MSEDSILVHRSRLSAAKRALLKKRLRGRATTISKSSLIPRRPESDSVPLSFAQWRLWFLDQLGPESTAYNLPAPTRLRGVLDVSVLAQSLDEVVQRHEVLRTTFAAVEGQPVQMIAPSSTVALPLVDLANLPQEERETEARRSAIKEVQRPFDLMRGPLMRLILLRLSAREHLLLLTMHHIITDVWSMGVLVQEVASLYEALSAGKPSPLAELPIQYADYALWQREWLQGELLETQLAYWKRQFDGNLPVLELSTDRPRPACQTYRGAHHTFELSTNLSEGLKALSHQEGVTLYMTLLAVFKTLLHRYTGQEDILVGTPTAGRNRTELEGLIGFFINTLVLRTNLAGNPTFRALLGRVREVALGVYAHQDLPFERLVERLQPERDLSRNPLFQVMFSLQNAPVPTLELSSLTLSPLVGVESGTTIFDLSLDIIETNRGLGGSFEYSTDLFDTATVVRMQKHFQTLLKGIVANPDRRLSDLPLLTEAERHQLLEEWNSAHVDYPKNACIHHLFEAQVERTPDVIAVVLPSTGLTSTVRSPVERTGHTGDEQITYQELNRRANRVAHCLRTLGVGPEVLVGICMERSVEMIVCALGVLKAGGAYVPLDSDYPKERLAFMLRDAQLQVLLTQQRLVRELPENGAQVICVDTDWHEIGQSCERNLVKRATPANIAYVIYTSGSTGKPKSVMITHHSLVSYYFVQENVHQLQSVGTCHLQWGSFSFDLFTGVLVRTLCSGKKLVIWPAEMLLEPDKLYTLMRREKVDCVEFVPVVMRILVDYLEETEQSLNFLRLLVLGSDIWYIKEYEQLQRFCGPLTRLINAYGPTEATIDSLYFEGTDINLPSDRIVPVGRPFPNTRVYILDSHLNPVPVGVAGELHVGGDGVARGYLNHPELTAAGFIPDPFSGEPGAHLYKTGDLARYLPDGNIEFLGRIDTQVKIRGFRIEVGEIETRLKEHPAVRDTVVTAWEDAPGDKRLVAYVALDPAHTVTIAEMRDFLKNRLPGYMVPSIFTTLEAIPLMPNGKADRGKLPPPDRTQSQRVHVAPRDELEQALADMWQKLLRVASIGIHDNFFELGGHSLLVSQLIFQLRHAFQVEFPVRRLFEAPTIAELAQAIRLTRQAGPGVEAAVAAVIDLKAEAILDPSIIPATVPFEHKAEPAYIFLTGATGFLGAYLLHELLQKTRADIYCLVRATNVEQGRERIQRNLERFLVWNESVSSRIIPVLGGLARPLLGLSSQQFEALAGQLDVIYHCGAWVNFTYPYQALKAVNVLGTQEILRLAGQCRVKPVHYVSTLSVFDSTKYYATPEVIREDDNLEDGEGLYGGYAQTKWVSEKLLKIAHSRGIPVCLYRPGLIGGHSRTGIAHTKDLVWCMIKGCIQLGCAPDQGPALDIVPVDYVSQAFIHLSRREELLGKAFHFLNLHSLPWSDLINWIQCLGYRLRQVPSKQWLAELLQVLHRSPDNVLSPFLPLFSGIASESAAKGQMPDLADERRFDCQNTLDGLAGTSIVCPPVDDELLNVYFSYLIDSGFLSAPAQVAAGRLSGATANVNSP